MSGHETSERLRKSASGACLILAPIGLIVGSVLHPARSFDAAEQLAIIGNDPQRWATAHWVFLATAMLLLGAVLAAAHLIHEHRPGYAIVGGALGLLGATSMVAIGFAEATFGTALGERATSADALAAFAQATTGPVSNVILVGAMLASVSAMVLGVGFYLADVVPPWMAAATIAGGVITAVSVPMQLHSVTITGSAVLALGLIPIGFMVLRETDEEWAHTPVRMSMA